jgi:hypothetical protein
VVPAAPVVPAPPVVPADPEPPPVPVGVDSDPTQDTRNAKPIRATSDEQRWSFMGGLP